ncbi:general secretion pathway protein A [Acidovorax sp. 107]|uniref:ExeA family protein n=1 Tax=Acidovorax sp. 107 TaxID=2135638 RepID=UPI000D3C7851|nr:ExeA family protein [Acidovorax sp. 107]PUA96352.1 general secretion pathway protein A [Acidovorax sp. 107]
MTASSIYATLGLSRNPFPPTPDAGSYFFTPRLEEDFAEIVHCIEARKGFVLLTGEVGLGKSTLVRRLLDTLSGKNCHSALILNTFLQDSALLSAVQTDFGLLPSDSVEQGLARLTEFLIAGHQAGDINLLVIDDAQNLSVESLELVRLLCNLETGQEKLLQILLVGQPELEETLATPELRQLKSRIIKHARLSGLQKDEITRYFDFRVNAAGAEGRLFIEPDAADVLHRATQGNLRRIHLVLDRCLYGLASTRASVVTSALVQRAVADLPALGEEATAVARVTGGHRGRKAWVLAGLLAGTSATVALAGWGLVSQPTEHPTPVAAEAAAVRAPEPARSSVTIEPPALPPGAGSVAATAMEPIPLKGTPPSGQACESQLKAAATADEVVHIYRLPEGMADSLKPTARLCRFNVDKESWVAWLGRNNARHIQAAEQATRKVQGKLKSMGLLDKREPDDGFFGSKTGEAFARFQQQQGLPPTGKPDELTFLLLEHQDASPR